MSLSLQTLGQEEAAPSSLLLAGAAAPRMPVRRPVSRHSERQADVAALSPADRRARDAQITAHQPLVHFVVGRMRSMAEASSLLDFEDLLSYGTEGLIAAVDSFEPGHGAKFSTWAVLKIRNAVLDGLRTLDPIARSTRHRGHVIDRTTDDLVITTGRWPTLGELAQALDEPITQLGLTLQELARETVSSLDRERSNGDDDGQDLHELLADDDPANDPAAVVDQLALYALLHEAIAQLPVREELLIALFYRENYPLERIATRLGVSSSRVSQLHARALCRLRASLATTTTDDTPAMIQRAVVRRPARGQVTPPVLTLGEALRRAA
jgi:RNA polymerase sigma factor for flagellar operon FliA